MKTKEELLTRIRQINEYWHISGHSNWGQNNQSWNNDALILSNFEESNDMCNFTLEFIELLKKYKVRMHGVNGMLETFEFFDAPGKFLGITDFFYWLLISNEQMENKIEEIKAKEEQKEDTDKEGNDEYLFENDNGSNNVDYDEENEADMCCYDASATFTADIELNIGKIEIEDQDEDLIQKCIDIVYNKIETKDDLYIETDYDKLLENTKIEELKDGTTLVKIKNVEFSMGIEIMAYNLDNANDDRWGIFSDKVNEFEFLYNVRDEYVSEAD